MKNIKMLVAVFAMVIAAASIAKAGGIELNFDGRTAGTVSFADLLQKSNFVQNDNIFVAAPVLEKVEPEAAGEIKVMVLMKTGAKEKKETLLCQGDPGKKELRACKKQSDFLFLTKEDVDGMALRRFFPSENGVVLLPAQTRHAYCNQSGPEFFNCKDLWVDKWEVVKIVTKYTTTCGGNVEWSYSGFPTISGGVDCRYTEEREEIKENKGYWTHECEKVDHC